MEISRAVMSSLGKLMDSYRPLRYTLMEQFISPIFIFKTEREREREREQYRMTELNQARGERNTDREIGGEKYRERESNTE